MQKIIIDLLPLEFRKEEQTRARFYKIQAAGIGFILLTVFLASLTVALRVMQSQQIVQIQTRAKSAEQKVSDLKNTQASLLLLKNRLTTINQYLAIPSRQTQMFDLIRRLMPAGSSIDTISIAKSGEVLILATILDSNSLDELIANLVSSESNEDKVSGVNIETLSRGKDGIFRLSFKVKPK